MNYFGMYVLTKLDSWHCFTRCSGWVLLFFIVLVMLIMLGVVDCNKDYNEKFNITYLKWIKPFHLKKILITAITLIIFSQLLPTTKQAAFIYIAPQIIENGAVKDTVKNIPELTKLGTDYLKELLKEKVEEKVK